MSEFSQRAVTIREVAAAAGVSIGTASKALNGRSQVRAERASDSGVAAMGNENALCDLRVGLRAGALVGNGLGGTSLINAGDAIPVWHNWNQMLLHAGKYAGRDLELTVWVRASQMNNGGRGYVPFTSTNLDSGQWSAVSSYAMPGRPRHGTVLPVTQAEYDRLVSKWG